MNTLNQLKYGGIQMKKRFIRLSLFSLLILTLSVGLIACASEPGKEEDSKEKVDTSGSKDGGELVISKAMELISLDPAGSNDTPSSDVQENIYETLTFFDDDMNIQPLLAESFEAIDDKVWEFKLKEDIKFHDGSEFNSEVVKANIERVIDDEIASPRKFLYEMVTDIEIVDTYTVRMTTEEPFAPLPAHLAHSGGGMVALSVIEEDYEAMENGNEPSSVINEKPIGTGYFSFDEWKSGESLRLVRNDNYWGENVHLDSVLYKFVPEDLTRVAELETGDTHISDPLSPSDVDQIDQADETYVSTQSSASLSYVGFNTQKEPFDDVRVRQAISMAIDKTEILEGIYEGLGVEAIGPIAPGIFGFDENVSGLEYDVEKAKELLTEAGYPDGFSSTIWTWDERERSDTAVNFQSQLKDIGIDLEIEELEWGAYLEKTANGEHEMFVLGWSTPTMDADYALYAPFHSENFGEAGNRTYTDDAKVDELLEKGRKTPDEEERLEIYSEVQELLVDIAPMIYLHHQDHLLGVREEVKGLSQSPTAILHLQEVYLDQ